MRSFSVSMRRTINDPVVSDPAVLLLTLTHPLLPQPIYVSSDPTIRVSTEPYRLGTISRGITYLFVPMMVLLPDDAEDRAPVTQIQFENVSRDLIALLRSTRASADVRMEIVMASAPDAVEQMFPRFQLKRFRADSSIVTLDLEVDALMTEPFPADSFGPSLFPGIF